MTDRPADDVPPETFADLPMQPTGSGVADLETAYERMKLTEDAGDVPVAIDADAESAAHPS